MHKLYLIMFMPFYNRPPVWARFVRVLFVLSPKRFGPELSEEASMDSGYVTRLVNQGSHVRSRASLVRRMGL